MEKYEQVGKFVYNNGIFRLECENSLKPDTYLLVRKFPEQEKAQTLVSPSKTCCSIL